MNQELLIFIGGILHFGILLASAMVPKVLDWKTSLNQLDGLSRQLVWVHGAFIVLVIAGFGLLSILFAGELATENPLARGVCLFIALFWGARLLVQLFVFDAKGYLKSTLLKAGYHGLTLVFLYNVVVYALAAM
jgi:ABC-type arginine/histidine transport system permease subunit